MKANELIELYITDITNRLPRRLRKDVGFELNALLQEELQAELEQAEPESEEAVAKKLLAGFGHPRDVAARYRTPIEIIDPVDSHSFAYAAVTGIVIIWIAGLASLLGRPDAPYSDYLLLFRDWWFEFGIAALWWPGFLLLMFAIVAQVRKRAPEFNTWRPRKVSVKDPDQINRAAWIAIVIFSVAGLVVLMSPTSILDLFYGGRAAPAAYNALRYDPQFYPSRGIWLFAILVVDLLLYLPLIYLGRWTPRLRRLDIGLSLVTCLIMVWVSALGNIFLENETDQFVKVIIGIIVLVTLTDGGIKLYREMRRGYQPLIWSK